MSEVLLVVAVALINEQNEILLAQRPEGKSMAGLWEFPGGKVEPGESPEAALIREIHEELSIKISLNLLKPLTFVSFDYESFHLLMPLYMCTQWMGEVVPREGQQVSWVARSKLHDYPAPPADIPLFDVLAEQERN